MKSTSLLLVALSLVPLMSNSTPAQEDLRVHQTPDVIPVRVLDATSSFESLTKKEKLYAHWMSQASWIGALICFDQVSQESPAILELLLRMYSKHPVTLERNATQRGVSQKDLERSRTYAARFLSNTGNYLSFGDTKFIPGLPIETFAIIVESAAAVDEDMRLMELWREVSHKIYSLEKDERALNLEDRGVSSYYGEDVSKDDIAFIQEWMESEGMEAWNTRIFKHSGLLELRVASVQQSSRPVRHKDRQFTLSSGDFSSVLSEVVHAFKMAYSYCANDMQRTMIRKYIEHFESGDIDLHKDSMRAWVQDKGPAVETNIGFIETYRDPIHVRAEWEGLVAMVNRAQSASFQDLVNAAGTFIPKLPWDKVFEKDEYRRPDFTSLEVLAFANGGIPAGINIPNYDEIRMNEGFKNVSLGNVLKSRNDKTNRVDFILESDQQLYKDTVDEAFEVQVGLHELLGHGCGKLLSETAPGEFNFDRNAIDPLTGNKVASWYKPGQTWGSVFGSIASSYEECRAEAVGLHLCGDADVLKIFGHEGQEANDVTYINWLSMARAGLAALPFYNTETKQWGQAHMQGRFALLQVMLRAGDGFVSVQKSEDGHWNVHMDRSKIATVGYPAVAEFLKKLNIYKATANVEAGSWMYADYTSPDETMIQIRSYALDQRKPRHLWVQPVTDLDAMGNVILRTYPGTYQGVIDSFLDRYSFMVN